MNEKRDPTPGFRAFMERENADTDQGIIEAASPFKTGQRIIVNGVDPCEDYPDGIKEEHGVIDMIFPPEHPGHPWMYLIEVDEPQDEEDDCFREVDAGHMRAEGVQA